MLPSQSLVHRSNCTLVCTCTCRYHCSVALRLNVSVHRVHVLHFLRRYTSTHTQSCSVSLYVVIFSLQQLASTTHKPPATCELPAQRSHASMTSSSHATRTVSVTRSGRTCAVKQGNTSSGNRWIESQVSALRQATTTG